MTALRCRAYLIVDADAEDVRPQALAALLRSYPVAAVLLRTSAASPERLRDQVLACQACGAAALIEGDAQLALSVAADGLHLPASAEAAILEQAYRQARSVLGPQSTIGGSAGMIRHDAMVLGELGADYVAFEDTAGEGLTELADLVSWWAEVFEVPCVAIGATDRASAEILAQAGADFVASGPAGGILRALEAIESFCEQDGR